MIRNVVSGEQQAFLKNKCTTFYYKAKKNKNNRLMKNSHFKLKNYFMVFSVYTIYCIYAK